MARADLLVALVRSACEGNQAAVARTVETMIAEERAKHHHHLAEELATSLSAGRTPGVASRSGHPRDLLYEVSPERKLNDLVLAPPTERLLHDLVKEQHRADLLRSYGLEPRHRILLVGAPGNGKTSVAECLAGELLIPLFVVRYEGVVASYLGETTARLQAVFDFLRTRHCVVLFDEFDAVAKERGDEHETGEIKRVVSSLLLQIDQLPSRVVVVAATNHSELLDRAVWRRFQARVDLPAPSRRQITDVLCRYSTSRGFHLGRSPRTLADRLHGASFGEIEEFATALLRRMVLAQPDADMAVIATEQLSEWDRRAQGPAGG